MSAQVGDQEIFTDIVDIIEQRLRSSKVETGYKKKS